MPTYQFELILNRIIQITAKYKFMNLFIAIHNSFQYIDFCIWEENGEGIETEFIWIATFLVQNKKGNREKLNCSKGSLYPIKISFQWQILEKRQNGIICQTVLNFSCFEKVFDIILIFVYFVFLGSFGKSNGLRQLNLSAWKLATICSPNGF